MSWNKIEEHLFEKYCVEGEDRELCRLMEEHEQEIRNKAIEEFVRKVCEYYTAEERAHSVKKYCCEIKQTIADIAEQMKEVGE